MPVAHDNLGGRRKPTAWRRPYREGNALGGIFWLQLKPCIASIGGNIFLSTRGAVKRKSSCKIAPFLSVKI